VCKEERAQWVVMGTEDGDGDGDRQRDGDRDGEDSGTVTGQGDRVVVAGRGWKLGTL